MSSQIVYVIVCDVWGGTHYTTELLGYSAYKETALDAVKQLESHTDKPDIYYRVEEVELTEEKSIQIP